MHNKLVILLRRGRDLRALFLSPMSGYSRKAAVCKPRVLSSELNYAPILTLDFPLSGIVRNKCLLFKLLKLWYFVTGDQAMTYTLNNLYLFNCIFISIWTHGCLWTNIQNITYFAVQISSTLALGASYILFPYFSDIPNLF